MALRILGLVLAMVGLVWALQGMGLLPGSFMTGDRTWVVVGAVMGAIGLALVFRSLRG